MTLSLKPLSVGMLGFDTIEALSAAQAATLVKAGMKFGVRYVPLSGQSSPFAIGKTELSALTQAGLGVMLVQFGRTSGWSESIGFADGQAAASYAISMGYPAGGCLWLDLANAGTADACIAYANAWYKGAVAGGMFGAALGIYCEPGVPLTSSQLYHALSVSRYWKTAGRAPDVDVRGYQMLQLYPGNRTISQGIYIDYDAVQSDYLGSYPVAAFL